MHPLVIDRTALLKIVDESIRQFDDSHRLRAMVATDPDIFREFREERAEEESALVVRELEKARVWAAQESQIASLRHESSPLDVTAAVPSEENIPYIPDNQTLSLVQSALESYLASQEVQGRVRTLEQFDGSDPRWLASLWEMTKALFRAPAKFVHHKAVTDFRFDLPSACTVALVSDWGTGNEHAIRVAQQIRERRPDHFIHLGDVYYSGTKPEIQKRFLDVLRDNGPDPTRCRHWALNSNHEMFSGGYGYFELTLKQFGQPASYFNLGNEHWRLIGLNTAHKTDHGLRSHQKEWLGAQLQAGGARAILLSHHQMFSAFDDRPVGKQLYERTIGFAQAGEIFGWIWGHEHKGLIYQPHLGMHCRCIGHGGIPFKVPFGSPLPSYPLVATNDCQHPDHPKHGINGFAILSFAGPSLTIEYEDEYGTVWYEEQF